MKKPTRTPDIIEFVRDSRFLGLSLSEAQETLLRAIYGLPLSESQLELYRLCTGRQSYGAHGFNEATVIAGARAGKDSRIAAPIVCYEALFGGHDRRLSKGERAIIPLVAQDQRATRVAFGYIKEYFAGSSLLASMVDEVLNLEIRLTNRISVLCFPCTQRSLRGWSIPAAVMDELAFFRLEGAADSDVEVQQSIRRGTISFPQTRFLKVSTPYMKSGVLYDDFKNHFGKDSEDVLVWRAPSTLMNPSLAEQRLERERRLDPQRFEREYMAEFAEDLESFLPTAWIDAAVVEGRHELPPMPGVTYVAACDPSGGGADAFTLCIVHAEGEQPNQKIVQDLCRGWKRARNSTVDLEGVVAEIAAILKGYAILECAGDRYSAAWVVQSFERQGILYRQTDKDKSAFYLETEPLFAQGRIEILDHPQLARELRLLERRPRPGGKTIVDHPSGSHDDHANSLALAAAKALEGVGSFDIRGFGSYVRPDWDTGAPSNGSETLASQIDAVIDGDRGGRDVPDW